MSKIQKEDCRTISIYDFRKWNSLSYYSSGMVTWTSSMSGDKNHVGYIIEIRDDGQESYLKLTYTITDRWSDEKHHIDQKYPIVSIPCHYGGRRYFFQCPLSRNGIYCGRKVAKLYLGAGIKYFGCRHCYDLTYGSRINGYSYCIPDIEKYAESIKRWYYRGKPTRKHLIYLRKESSFENSFIRIAGRLGSRGL